MTALYENQSAELRINLFNDEYHGATDARILYEKPSGEKGYWPAVIDGQKAIYTTVTGDFDEVGEWKLQPYVKTSDNQEHFGETIIKQIIKKSILP